jgi:hypothetical protein
MAKQLEDDPGFAKKKNNFIATAKAKYSGFERRKRTISSEPGGGDKTVSVSSQAARPPGLLVEGTQSRLPVRMGVERKGSDASVKGSYLVPETRTQDNSRAPTPESYLRKESMSDATELAPTFKPVEYGIKRSNTPPISVSIPTVNTTTESQKSSGFLPAINRARSDSLFEESPILGNTGIVENHVSELSIPTPSSPDLPYPASISLDIIPEEKPAFGLEKPPFVPEKPVEKPLEVTPSRVPEKLMENPSEVKRSPVSEKRAGKTFEWTKSQNHSSLERVLNPEPVPRKAATVPDPAPSRFKPSIPRAPEPQIPEPVSSPPSPSTSSIAQPISSCEDLSAISMDEKFEDALSDTSVDDSPPKPPKPNTTTRTTTPEIPLEHVSSNVLKSSSSRASKIWLGKNGTNIHTKIVEYLSDAEEDTPSPVLNLQAEKPVSRDSGDIDLDSQTPYKHSLKHYDLFRGLTKKMACENKERLDALMGTKPLTQKNICMAFFGYDSITQLVQAELAHVKAQSIGLSELLLKLWLGKEIDDEALLKAILFGKSNGLADSLILTLSPLGSIYCECTNCSRYRGVGEYDALVQ